MKTDEVQALEAERKLRADLQSKLAGIADCINTELRENYGDLDQVTDYLGDMRPAIRLLVDKVRARCERESVLSQSGEHHPWRDALEGTILKMGEENERLKAELKRMSDAYYQTHGVLEGYRKESVYPTIAELLGNLLDHWDGVPNDLKSDPGMDNLTRALKRIHAYVEAQTPPSSIAPMIDLEEAVRVVITNTPPSMGQCVEDELRKLPCVASAIAERDRVLNEAMEAIAAEHLEAPQGDEDWAYDQGVTDSYCAVKRMLSKYTTDRTGDQK